MQYVRTPHLNQEGVNAILNHTIQSAHKYACSRLNRLEAELLSCHALGITREQLWSRGSSTVKKSDFKTLQSMVARRVQSEPIAYILGSQAFWDIDIEVSPDVLIPRPDTEILVEAVLPFVKANTRLLDLGTGSGCLALVFANEKKVQVTASDISDAALRICQHNAKYLELDVELLKSNWFEKVRGRYGVIVSNPPYIRENDPHLNRGDLVFEPQLALTGGFDGLEAIRTIVSSANDYLEVDGILAIEHGYDQRDAVLDLYHTHGYRKVNTYNDLGDNPRVVLGQRS